MWSMLCPKTRPFKRKCTPYPTPFPSQLIWHLQWSLEDEFFPLDGWWKNSCTRWDTRKPWKCISLWHKHDGTFAISTGAGFLPSSRWSDVSGGEWQKRWAVRSPPCLLDQLEGILFLQEIITELSNKLIVTSLFFSISQCTYKHSLRDSIDYLIGIISQAMIFSQAASVVSVALGNDHSLALVNGRLYRWPVGQSHLNGECRSFGGFKLSKELFDFLDFQPTGEDYEVESRLTHMIRKGVACQHQLNNGTIWDSWDFPKDGERRNLVHIMGSTSKSSTWKTQDI